MREREGDIKKGHNRKQQIRGHKVVIMNTMCMVALRLPDTTHVRLLAALTCTILPPPFSGNNVSGSDGNGSERWC